MKSKKSDVSNGWKVLGWLTILIFIWVAVLGAYFLIKPKIGMEELDIQVELNTPAGIPIRPASEIASKISGKSINVISRKNEFISLLQTRAYGQTLVTERVVKKGFSHYQLSKDYYFFPKSSKISFLYQDVYYFKKISNWRKSKILTLAPNYVTFINLEPVAKK